MVCYSTKLIRNYLNAFLRSDYLHSLIKAVSRQITNFAYGCPLVIVYKTISSHCVLINQVSSFSVQLVMLEILLNLFEIGCPIAYAVKANITIEINY